MKHILLPTDFSDTAEQAIKYAIDLFQHEEVLFTLLHIHDFSLLENITLDDCEDRLKQALNLFPDEHHEVIHTVETALGSGDIVNGILSYARNNGVDVIVMGTQGSSRPRWMGSNTEEVLLRAGCPVMAIPNDVSFQSVQKAVVPLDPEDFPSGEQFNLLCQFMGAARPVFHVFSVLTSDRNQNDLEATARTMMGEEKEFNVTVSDEKDIAEAILSFCDRIEPDLVLLFPRKRKLFKHLLQKSVSRKVAHITRIPLLSITID